MGLKGKRVLITAGPTWVAIDKVRVISNIATGEIGMLLAEKLNRLGAKVTLLLGCVHPCCLDKKIKVLHFSFFSELKDGLERELATKKYDILIHSAAVSDYRPAKSLARKVSSDLKFWNLKLIRTPKLIARIKRIVPKIFLVAFKFEPGSSKIKLLRQAKKLLLQVKADLVIANTFKEDLYQAYLVNRDGFGGMIRGKADLAQRLVTYLKKR